MPAASAFDVAAVGVGLAALQPDRLDAAAVPPEDSAAIATPVARGRAVPTIELDELVHRYGNGVEAVRRVSMRIEPGEAVAIVGQNGSGKTTLAKHLDGLLRPSSGDVRLDGRSIAGTSIDRLAATVGFVFQDPGDQLFERSVQREVAFGPRNLGYTARRIATLVDDSLEAVGLSNERDTNPYDLDPSRRKLVALAAVLAMDPAILVLDEPTTGQDPVGIERLGTVVRSWRAAGRTAIAITHDMAFAAAVFDRVVVMRQGEVIVDGPPSSVLAAGNAGLLATSGLTPPPLAQVAAALGLNPAPADVRSLLAALRARGRAASRSYLPRI